MVRAFGYLRVSGKSQVGGDGFPRQRAAINAYAKEHDIKIVKWFEERGVSGAKDLDHRPALQELMVALLANGVHVVLVEKLDRLARDLMIQETIIGDLHKRGFELVSVAEPDLCKADPTRTLLRQMMGAIAQYEKTMIVLKLRAARQRARVSDSTWREGRKPFGSRPGEQTTIARMKALHGQGLSLLRIAEQLQREGLKPRAADHWQAATIARILKRG
jgi:DNA invertase Pin-like site-specific DNA recombinase